VTLIIHEPYVASNNVVFWRDLVKNVLVNYSCALADDYNRGIDTVADPLILRVG
jgi:hypothetical protein